MLEDILNTSLKVIKEKYGLSKEKIRAFIHYMPSY